MKEKKDQIFNRNKLDRFQTSCTITFEQFLHILSKYIYILRF